MEQVLVSWIEAASATGTKVGTTATALCGSC
jgi:hypothetical protein